MTPDKCEHQEKDDNTGRGISWIEPLNDGAVCDTCGQRFVPSDVLEEARDALAAIQWQAELGYWEEGGCSECGSHGPVFKGESDRPHERDEPHKPGCKVASALARIDAFLGIK